MWHTNLLLLLAICGNLLSHTRADEAAATTLAPAANASTTTVKPKINIAESALCKKCICDTKVRLLNCSHLAMTDWFSVEEWQTLQNGDVIFDTINLQYNNLTSVPVIPTYDVKSLFLSFNRISNISLAAFKNLTKLEKLDLSHNQITSKTLIPDVFKGTYSIHDYLSLHTMRELHLCSNNLHTLNSDVFEHLPNLEVLSLCKNQFINIDHQTEVAIAGIHSLKTLDMSYMEISQLPVFIFHSPRDLEELILSGNLFKQLPEALANAPNITRLVLDENPLEDLVGNNTFKGLTQLQYLSISYMPDLTTIGKGALSSLQSLKTLIAVDNKKLSYIDAAAFAKPTSNPKYADYPPLKELYLRNNNLSILEGDWIMRWDKVDTIDLRFNPWRCDCSNSFMVHDLMLQINNDSNVYAKDVICQTPVAWQGSNVLSVSKGELDLECHVNEQYSSGGIVLVCLIIGMLIGVPITMGTLIIYRRGCFGMVRNRHADTALYNRASFSGDFHI